MTIPVYILRTVSFKLNRFEIGQGLKANMVPKRWTLLISCLMLLLFCEHVKLQDPCNAKTLGNLPQRLIGYTLGPTELPLSDYRLRPGWYSLPDGFTLATEPTPCGTLFNWWLKDPLPTSGDSIVHVCQRYLNNTCLRNTTITVRKCPTGYAYELNPTGGDLAAYCIESVGDEGVQPDEAPDISGLRPTISAAVHTDGDNNTLEFYCKFTAIENLIYDVEWSLHSGASILSSLLLVKNIAYEKQQMFLDKTKLAEQDLKDNLVFKPGFTLVCAVRARISDVGLLSSTIVSPPKFCGIRILTPSVIRVEKDETVDIQLELTIPFGCLRPGCSLSFEMLVPPIDGVLSSCMLSELATLTIPIDGRFCGVMFQDAGDIATFRVAATFGNNLVTPTSRAYELAFSSHTMSQNHPFFQDYQLPTITIELLVDQSQLQNKVCRSVSDPHMKTFDGMKYENQNLGTFILYRHKELEAEVQMKTSACSNNNRAPYCNCGVAVRAGKDIFVINNCGGVVQPPRFVHCQDGVLYRQITKNGATYEIILPHGTKVTLTMNHGRFVNVHIYPSLVDEGKNEGLCGLFDNSLDGDQLPRRVVEELIDIWRVPQNEDLFLPTNYNNMNGWKEDLFFCHCSHNVEFFQNTQCSSQRRCRIDADAPEYPRQDMCDLNIRRKKRDTGGITFDTYTDPTTAFYSTMRTEDTSIEHNSRIKRQAPYNKLTARAECLRMMNTSMFQKCDEIPNLDIDNMIENCVLDAVMTNSMDWTMSHLESIKLTCLEHVEVMQPLPPEVRAELVVLPDANSIDNNNGKHEYPPLPPPTMSSSGPNPISPELLQEMKTHSCPNECQAHGRCENGKCKCDEPFGSFDCSIDKTQPPIMSGIPDKGECDLQQRRCRETAVFGTNFAETPSLSCRLKHFMVDKNNTIRYGQSVDVPGNYESMFEVYCPFPESRRKRSVTNDVSNDDIAYGYHTSVSNDGKSFSQGDTIVIYDSQCVNCSKVHDRIICIKESGYCVRNSRCYLPGESSGCYTCADEGGHDVEWSSGPECNAAEPQTIKVWMIGAIAVSCVVVVIVVIAVFCKIRKKKDGSQIRK